MSPCRQRPRSWRAVRILCLGLLVVALLLPRPGAAGAVLPGAGTGWSTLDDIGRMLDSEQAFAREEPFAGREFTPALRSAGPGNAVAYGPYRRGQAPGQLNPTRVEILEDLRIIARHWTMIRVYNADDVTEDILETIEEQGLPLKVMLGVWLAAESGDAAEIGANRTNVLRGIDMARTHPGTVVAVCVGNETQVSWSGNRMSPARLIHYVRACRAQCAQPVTTADDHGYWLLPESRSVADELDFITTHIHPLWNGRTIATAGAWLEETWQQVGRLHAGKTVVLGETGWATAYDADKLGDGAQGTLIKGDPKPDTQAAFLAILDRWIVGNQVTCFLFEAFDEPWKGGGDSTGPMEVEKHWGVYDAERQPKAFLRDRQDPAGGGDGGRSVEP